LDARAWGCNVLIPDGATLGRSVKDIIDALTPQIADPADTPQDMPQPASDTKNLRDIATLHTEILSRLSAAPIAEDQLLRDIKVNATVAAPVLVELELDGKVKRQPGGLLARVV